MSNIEIIFTTVERQGYDKLYYRNKEGMRSEINSFFMKKIEVKKKSMQSLKAKKADALRSFENQADELNSQISTLQRSLSKMLAHFEASVRRFERFEAESEQQRQTPPQMSATPSEPTPEEPVPLATTPQAPPEDNFKRPAEKRKRRAPSATMSKPTEFPKIENIEELLDDIDMKISVVSEKDVPKDPRKVML